MNEIEVCNDIIMLVDRNRDLQDYINSHECLHTLIIHNGQSKSYMKLITSRVSNTKEKRIQKRLDEMNRRSPPYK